jgi:PTS system nitrogen regulatory IIA component
MMELSCLLKPASVKVLPGATSKKRLLQSLAEFSESIIAIDAATIFKALQARETLGPTGVGHGVALPHAPLKGLDAVQGVFLKLETPVAFDAIDRKPVDLVFALYADNATGTDHLKALAAVSRLLRDPSICAKLRANSDPMILHAILTANKQVKAA